jgi:hypothetical protein
VKIKSDFYDYYDNGSTIWDSDKSLIYVRKTKEIEYSIGSKELNNDFFKMVNSLPRFQESGVIGFCGKAYPFYKVQWWGNKSKTYYSLFEMEKDIMSEGYYDKCLLHLRAKCTAKTSERELAFSLNQELKKFRNTINVFLHDKGLHNRGKTNLDVFNSLNKEIADELFIKHDVPIFMASKIYDKSNTMVLNPRLKDYTFISQYDPSTAYQEISMYLGNNLAKQVDPSVNFSDELKINAAGFDKFSFRNRSKNNEKK